MTSSFLFLLVTIGAIFFHQTAAFIPQCKVYLDKDKDRFVDLNVLAKDQFYGPVLYNATEPWNWHYYINICAPVRKQCWSSADYFAAQAGAESDWVMHDDYGSIQVQNSQLPDKEHVDCNFLGARFIDENDVYISAKVTNVELKHFSVVYEKGENLTWAGQTFNRKTVINVRCNRNLDPDTTNVLPFVAESSSPPGVYTFEVESSMVCEEQKDSHWPPLFPLGILGLMFLLIVFVFILYWPIGAVINLIRKKKGIEIIPNLYFWRSIPTLFVDGITWPLVLCGIGRRAPATGLEIENQDIFDEA